jgi:hypothetical protein
VTTTSFLRRRNSNHRQTHLAVIELPDEMSAFQAYRLLHYHGISPENIAIVGEGYSSPERIGLLRPTQIAVRKAMSFSLVGGSLGSVLGFVLCIASLPLTDWRNWLLVVPAIGMIAGFGGAILGGILGLFQEGTAASLYRSRLARGRYLLMIEGSEKLVRWGQEVLSQYATSRLY